MVCLVLRIVSSVFPSAQGLVHQDIKSHKNYLSIILPSPQLLRNFSKIKFDQRK